MAFAKSAGLEGVALTNHGAALGDGACDMHFSSLRHMPKEIFGVRLLTGAEANILDEDGNLDINDYLLSQLEVVIASIHPPCFNRREEEGVTQAWLNVMENENVDILGHIGDGRYMSDYEAIVKKAKEKSKIIEINNHSFLVRPGSGENCKRVALLCKKYGVPVVLSTDAHFSREIGIVPKSIALMEETEFPEELILNTSLKKLCDFLRKL